MPIRNPYGVGESGEDKIQKTTSCDCCQLPFAYVTLRTKPVRSPRCDNCTEHAKDGSLAQINDMLLEHEPRLRQWIFTIRAKAGELNDEVDNLKIKLREQGSQIAAALESRDRHRNVVVAVMELHQECANKLCACGARYPCATVAAMYRSDSRISDFLKAS